jgi:hypothetical protein
VAGYQVDKHGQVWDEKTRALAACLEALLELHREQQRVESRTGGSVFMSQSPEPIAPPFQPE